MNFKHLYQKFLLNTITQPELEQLMKYFQEQPEQLVKDQIQETLIREDIQAKQPDAQHMENLLTRINHKISLQEPVVMYREKSPMRWVLKVAAVFILLGIGAYLFF